MTFTIYEKMFQITNQTIFFSVLLFVNMEFGRTRMQERHKSGWKPSFFFGLLRFSIFLSFSSTQIDPQRRDAPHLKKVGATTGALLVLRMDIFWDPSSVKTSPSHVKPQMRFSKNRGAPKSFPKIRLYYVLIRAMTCNDSNDSIWKPTFWGDNEPLFWECTSHW